MTGVNHVFNFKKIIGNLDKLVKNSRNRNAQVNVDRIAELYGTSVKQQFELNQLGKERNLLNKKGFLGEDMIKEGRKLKIMMTEKAKQLKITQEQLEQEAKHLPNETHESVPIGPEANAKLLYSTKIPEFSFTPKTHLEICDIHNMLDIDRAGKVSGSGSYFLKNTGVLLEMALTRYAMDICIENGFTPVITPDIIRHSVLDACGFSPRSTDPQTYFLKTQNCGDSESKLNHELILAATAEFPLAGMYSNEILERKKLPIRFVGMGHAFRAEGFGGMTNRGLYRVHQFTKVELFSLSLPEDSQEVFFSFVEIQKSLLDGLELSYRVLNMPTEELGAPAYIKYDIEAWMPGRNSYGEVKKIVT